MWNSESGPLLDAGLPDCDKGSGFCPQPCGTQKLGPFLDAGLPDCAGVGGGAPGLLVKGVDVELPMHTACSAAPQRQGWLGLHAVP